MSRLLALGLALALVPLAVARTYAWGGQGHRVIARIALTRLTPDVQRTVTAILGPEDFVTIASWADDVRGARPETYNWHFVNIPHGPSKYDAASDCKPSDRGDCVVAAIERLRKTLADVNAPAAERRDALKFVVHFVGDLHQPLHTIANNDRGGNDVRVNGDAGRVTNLHSVWDSGAISRLGLDEAAYTQRLMDDLRARPVPAADERVDVVKWVEDSHRVAVADVYKFSEFVPGAPPPAPISLPDAYFTRAQEVIARQMQFGGVRLAALLNETLGTAR